MKILNEVSFDVVIQAWLQAEWYLPDFDSIRKTTPELVINSGDINNKEENKLRLSILSSVRSPILDPLPKDTVWYKATFDKEDVRRTYIVPSIDWGKVSNNTYSPTIIMKNIDMDDGHAKKVKKIKSSLTQSVIDKRLILVATEINSTMTIIEGNHRGIAIFMDALGKNTSNPIIDKIIIGISPSMKNYVFHIEKYMTPITQGKVV